MEWIKASERLPELARRYYVKEKDESTHTRYFNGKEFEYMQWELTDIDSWLDESESSPSTVWPEEFEITEAYIKIHNGINGFALWKAAISWLKSYTAPDQPEQFSREDMIGFAEWIDMNLWYYEGGFWFNSLETMKTPDELLTEYLKNKK